MELSRRLGALLAAYREAAGDPAPEAFLFPAAGAERRRRGLPGLDPRNYRQRWFNRVCERAELGHRTPKDLRDTYASQLLTAGIQLGFISQQLGHSNTHITAARYAKWAEGEYRKPIRLRRGEVAADLLARLGDGARGQVLRRVK